MTTIPASAIVNVTPSVLSAGGSALDLSMLMLTNGTRVPIGTVAQFASAAAVSSYFGPSANETALAAVYFQGFEGSQVKPGNVLFAQYPTVAVPAFLRGGNVSALTLAALQAINGTLTVIVDGYARTAGSLNLAAAASFSAAATIIGTALNASPATQASFTGVIAGTTLTASSFSGSPIAIGQTVVGAGITAGTIITALGSGTGGNGTYTVNNSQSVSSEAMTTQPTPVVVTYDSISGGFVVTSGVTDGASSIVFATGTTAAALDLTLVTGAVTSQGASASTPSGFMNGIANTTQNWATFMTAFNPDNSGNTNKLAFSAWNSGQNSRYAYICVDTDASPTTQVPATNSLGYLISQAGYTGTCLIYDPSGSFSLAAFVGAVAASLNFSKTNGRTTFSYASAPGLTATVTDPTVATNLIANGYNFYGAYAGASQSFTFFQTGQISGPFKWMDSYLNQIWLNNSFQLSLLNLLSTVNSIPYNAAGNALIEAALADSITAGLNFGVFRAGVVPSASQAAQVNAAAGVTISTVLAQRGWYLQVLTPSATVRQARGTPNCNFWYMDGQSVQKISLNSVNLQ
jgi:hypothetical protein